MRDSNALTSQIPTKASATSSDVIPAAMTKQSIAEVIVTERETGDLPSALYILADSVNLI